MIVLFFFLIAVQQKAALEKEAKLSILEAGVADVSTRFMSLSLGLWGRGRPSETTGPSDPVPTWHQVFTETGLMRTSGTSGSGQNVSESV